MCVCSHWQDSSLMVPVWSTECSGNGRTWKRAGRPRKWPTFLSISCLELRFSCPMKLKFRPWTITAVPLNLNRWLGTLEKTVSQLLFIYRSQIWKLMQEYRANWFFMHCFCNWCHLLIYSFMFFCLAAPMSAPNGVEITVHNSTLAEVQWEPVSFPSVRGKLQGYKVYFDGWWCLASQGFRIQPFRTDFAELVNTRPNTPQNGRQFIQWDASAQCQPISSTSKKSHNNSSVLTATMNTTNCLQARNTKNTNSQNYFFLA